MKNPNGYDCVKHLSGSRRNPLADDSGMPYTYSRLARLFTRVMKLVHGEKHKLHDTRHTCATWLDDAEVNDNAKKNDSRACTQ